MSSKLGDVDTMFRYICEGADINFRNSTSSDSTPLIQAVHSVSTSHEYFSSGQVRQVVGMFFSIKLKSSRPQI